MRMEVVLESGTQTKDARKAKVVAMVSQNKDACHVYCRIESSSLVPRLDLSAGGHRSLFVYIVG